MLVIMATAKIMPLKNFNILLNVTYEGFVMLVKARESTDY